MKQDGVLGKQQYVENTSFGESYLINKYMPLSSVKNHR